MGTTTMVTPVVGERDRQLTASSLTFLVGATVVALVATASAMAGRGEMPPAMRLTSTTDSLALRTFSSLPRTTTTTVDATVPPTAPKCSSPPVAGVTTASTSLTGTTRRMVSVPAGTTQGGPGAISSRAPTAGTSRHPTGRGGSSGPIVLVAIKSFLWS